MQNVKSFRKWAQKEGRGINKKDTAIERRGKR
jgi:hypothetical protein